MRYWVANTDLDWFNYLASVAPDDVNFWQPNAVRPITLDRGAPWLFKLHNRQGGWIVGGGFFAHYTTMTPRFAWDAFGNANAAGMTAAAPKYRAPTVTPRSRQGPRRPS